MDTEHDRLFNVHWWAGALIQRHALDLAAHLEGREQQKVGEAHPDNPIGPGYVLSDWDKAWITDRVNDILRDRLLARQEHAPVLDEPLEEHEARELRARAQDYFGGSHDETRAKFKKLRNEHEAHHTAAHKAKDRELVAAHATALEQIDSHLGLVDRHIATVKVEVGEKRRIAQQHIDDCAKVLEVPYADVVAEYLARVEAEIRIRAWEAE